MLFSLSWQTAHLKLKELSPCVSVSKLLYRVLDLILLRKTNISHRCPDPIYSLFITPGVHPFHRVISQAI